MIEHPLQTKQTLDIQKKSMSFGLGKKGGEMRTFVDSRSLCINPHPCSGLLQEWWWTAGIWIHTQRPQSTAHVCKFIAAKREVSHAFPSLSTLPTPLEFLLLLAVHGTGGINAMDDQPDT
jgi:hypothetical protein